MRSIEFLARRWNRGCQFARNAGGACWLVRRFGFGGVIIGGGGEAKRGSFVTGLALTCGDHE